MVTTADSLEERKGNPVQLRGDTLKKYIRYEGAWFDDARESTPTGHYVIIDLPDRGFISVRVLKENCWEPEGPPTNYTDAAFDQYPELKVALDHFTFLLARCRVQLSKKVSNKIKESYRVATRKVMRRGRKEWWPVDESGLPPADDQSPDSSSVRSNMAV